jgi:hypothetical protein
MRISLSQWPWAACALPNLTVPFAFAFAIAIPFPPFDTYCMLVGCSRYWPEHAEHAEHAHLHGGRSYVLLWLLCMALQPPQ